MSLLIQPKLPVVMPGGLVGGGTVYGTLNIRGDLLLPDINSKIRIGSGGASIELSRTNGLMTYSSTDLSLNGGSGKIYFRTGGVLKVEITSTLSKWYQNIDMGTNKIVNLADPTDLQDAATKNYVDNAIAGGGNHNLEHRWLDPNDAVMPTTGGATLETREHTNFVEKVLSFDPNTDNTAYWKCLGPYSEETSGTCVASIYFYCPTATSGDVVFVAGCKGVGDGENWTGASLTTNSVTTTVPTTAGLLKKATVAVGPPAPWKNDVPNIISLMRDADNANDTCADPIKVIGVVIEWH